MFQAGSTVLEHIQEKASEYASEQASQQPWCSQFIGPKPTLLGLFFFWKRYPQVEGFKIRAHTSIFCVEKSGWWQLKYVVFLPRIPGEMIQFDEHIFQIGWFKHQLHRYM